MFSFPCWNFLKKNDKRNFLNEQRGLDGHCNTLFGHIIDETKRIGVMLRQCQFQHVCREGNRLAHGLVRRVVLSIGTDVWVEDLLGNLDDVFQSELS